MWILGWTGKQCQRIGGGAQGRIKVGEQAALPPDLRKAPGFPGQTASLLALRTAGRLSLPAVPRGSVRVEALGKASKPFRRSGGRAALRRYSSRISTRRCGRAFYPGRRALQKVGAQPLCDQQNPNLRSRRLYAQQGQPLGLSMLRMTGIADCRNSRLVSCVRNSLKKSARQPTGGIVWPTATAVGPEWSPSPARRGRGHRRGGGHFSQGFEGVKKSDVHAVAALSQRRATRKHKTGGQRPPRQRDFFTPSFALG
jgi:hypothetical protein